MACELLIHKLLMIMHAINHDEFNGYDNCMHAWVAFVHYNAAVSL